MIRAIAALTRASWYQARSYRMSLVLQVGGLMLTVVPLYFIANALQSTMAQSIAPESEQFYSFVLVGSIALAFVNTAMVTLPGTISAGISTGYFEALLMTRAPLPAILAGLTSYGVLLTAVRSTVMLLAGWFLGATIGWSGALPALAILAILVLAHLGVGLMAAALVIAFRTSGPLTQVFSTLSVLFGGVYFPVSSIPSWLRTIADLTPLAYGLRALRRVLIQGASLPDVWQDVTMVVAIGALLLIIGAFGMQAALRSARRAGTLGTY